MVQYGPAGLDATFAALADPTRRAMLQALGRRGPLPVSVLGSGFAISLPAVLKHVNVLAEAGLLQRRKTGRTVMCALTPEPMRDAARWIAHYEQFWSGRLDALAELVESQAWQKPQPNRTSRSAAASLRRPSGSSRPGSSRKR
jgi:DNA-binding transcriptional ArsR family regulator